MNKSAPIGQKVRWQSGESEPGLKAESEIGTFFVPWEELKSELENGLLMQLGRVLGDTKVAVTLDDFHGRKNWLINIVDEKGEGVGSVWLGGDPENGWRWDGLVRVGKAIDENNHIVWQVFERYSDGSYRRIVAKDKPEDRIRS